MTGKTRLEGVASTGRALNSNGRMSMVKERNE